jgi:hypothetical protein
LVATIQWWADPLVPGPARILWVPGASPNDPRRIAWDPDCCCIIRNCGDCPNGTVPACLSLSMFRFRTNVFGESGYDPDKVDCSEASGDFILQFADPRPDSVFWTGDGYPAPIIGGDAPPCVYRYYFPGPTSQGMYGWGTELFLMTTTPHVIVYPLGPDDLPWRYDPVLRKRGEWGAYWPGFGGPVAPPLACNDFTVNDDVPDPAFGFDQVETLGPPDCAIDFLGDLTVSSHDVVC